MRKMSRKGIIISLVVLVLMLGCIAFGISSLYSGRDGEKVQVVPAGEKFPLLKAVPSDAAAVFCLDGSRSARKIAADSTGLFASVISTAGAGPEFRAFLSRAASAPMAVSLHNSGTFVPLFAIGTGKNGPDAELLGSAETAGLGTRYVEDMRVLLVSGSETLLASSERHIAEGLSIVVSDGLSEIASALSGDNVVLISHKYINKLLQNYLTAPYRKYSDGVKRFADWTGFRIELSSDGFSLSGAASSGEEASYSLNMFVKSAGGDLRMAEILPEYTYSAVSVPVGDISGYLTAHRNYKDASGGLDGYSKAMEQKARELDIREVASASFRVQDSVVRVVLVRCGSKAASQKTVSEYAFKGMTKTLFGGLFSLDDESFFTGSGDWMIVGSRAAVEVYASGAFPGNTLRNRLHATAFASFKDVSFALWYAPAESPEGISGVIRDPLLKVLRTLPQTPVTFTVYGGGRQLDFRTTGMKDSKQKTKVPAIPRDTVVTVPEGPFSVMNSGSGQMNTFYQNSSMYLCLNDENGKGLWGIPFKTPLCGRVETIDYYANGKLQFLFASGSKLYLLDRLGRFVSGFPVELGKEVLLGPDVYDFTGAHGYSAVVLHTDNTIEMYDMHGRRPASWQTIKAPEGIMGLPELIEAKGRRVWAVRTYLRTLIYDFNGGKAIAGEDRDKMFRPDTELTVSDKGVISGICYDGRKRDIKLN